MRSSTRLLRLLTGVTLCALSLPGCDGSGTERERSSLAVDAPTAPVTETEGLRVRPELRRAYFGNLQASGAYAVESSGVGTGTSLDDAYRYARGKAIEHPAGFDVQRRRPLDFYAVTNRELSDPTRVASAWQDIRDAAARHDDPGTFTTFVGYEYRSGPEPRNRHRTVIFRSDAVPELPLPRLDAGTPEDLWDWLDRLRDRGMEALAIAHGADAAGSRRFATSDGSGAGYAERRGRNEPLVNVTRLAGTSESRLRDALLQGLVLEAEQGFNPFRFGLVGASHRSSGAVPPAEDEPFGRTGVTGIWAEANERGALYDALRRREVFASSGPRLRLRLFAGFFLAPDLPERPDALAHAYRRGVPMGSDLLALQGQPLRLWVQAQRDPDSAGLQRLQIVKGWVEDGEGRARVFDVACAGGRQPQADHSCPDDGAVLDSCEPRADTAAAGLDTLWEDDDYDPAVPTFYYARVLENPTCRPSTQHALRRDVDPGADVPATVQEQAWSSPIWLHPG